MKEKINLLATIIFNIKAFGLRIGIKRPVLIYGKIKTYNIGTIKINCPVKKGIIVIGKNKFDVPYSYTIFNNQGVIEVNGKLFLHFGTKVHNTGVMFFLGNNIVGHGVSFDIKEKLEVGFNTNIGFMSVVSDTNVHYTLNVNNRRVYRKSSSIKLGSFNWIGSYTHIKKGAVTPDYTIVSSPNTMIAKDYSDIEPYSILSGSPAKVLSTGLRRIYNFKKEHIIDDFFTENPNEAFYQIENEINLDDFCKLL